MTGLTRYSNLAESTVVAATSYTYDHANQMTGITDKNASGTTLVSYGYTYDDAGRVTEEARTWDSGSSTDTLTYGYTNNNQLTSVTHTNGSFANESFSWDANGNQTGTGYTTTTGNEQTASPGYTYTYDADGNMITATDTTTGDMWTYSYDFRNRMTGAVETDSSDTVLAQVTYTYDALDNRIGIDREWRADLDALRRRHAAHGLHRVGLFGNAVSERPGRSGRHGAGSRQSAGGTVAWYLPDRLGVDPRPDRQLGVDHRPRGLQRLRDGAGRVEPVERRPDDGLRGAAAGYGHGAELGGAPGPGSGDGEVDEPGPVGILSGGCEPGSVRWQQSARRQRSCGSTARRATVEAGVPVISGSSPSLQPHFDPNQPPGKGQPAPKKPKVPPGGLPPGFPNPRGPKIPKPRGGYPDPRYCRPSRQHPGNWWITYPPGDPRTPGWKYIPDTSGPIGGRANGRKWFPPYTQPPYRWYKRKPQASNCSPPDGPLIA